MNVLLTLQHFITTDDSFKIRMLTSAYALDYFRKSISNSFSHTLYLVWDWGSRTILWISFLPRLSHVVSAKNQIFVVFSEWTINTYLGNKLIWSSYNLFPERPLKWQKHILSITAEGSKNFALENASRLLIEYYSHIFGETTSTTLNLLDIVLLAYTKALSARTPSFPYRRAGQDICLCYRYVYLDEFICLIPSLSFPVVRAYPSVHLLERPRIFRSHVPKTSILWSPYMFPPSSLQGSL